MNSVSRDKQIRCSAFIATSLDGFIARKNGSIDWLEKANSLVPKGEDCGFSNFFSQMDCLIMGRASFETVLGFPQWPYGNKPVIVMTRKGVSLPSTLPPSVEVSSEPLNELLIRLSRQGMKNAYIDGGNLIQSFLTENLLNEITITRIPVLIGEGIPLFGPLQSDVHLKLAKSLSWPFGFVQDHYRVHEHS